MRTLPSLPTKTARDFRDRKTGVAHSAVSQRVFRGSVMSPNQRIQGDALTRAPDAQRYTAWTAYRSGKSVSTFDPKSPQPRRLTGC